MSDTPTTQWVRGSLGIYTDATGHTVRFRVESPSEDCLYVVYLHPTGEVKQAIGGDMHGRIPLTGAQPA